VLGSDAGGLTCDAVPSPWAAWEVIVAACPVRPGCMGRNFVAHAKAPTAPHTRKKLAVVSLGAGNCLRPGE